MSRIFLRLWRTQHHYFWVGLAGAAAMVLLVLSATAISQVGIGKRDITVEFLQAAGLREGDQVRLAGIGVGEVHTMELAGDRVIAVLRTQSSLPLGAETRAEIKLSNILGARYVELTPDGSGELDGHIGLAHSRVPFDLERTVEEATPILEELDGDVLAETLKTLTDELDSTPELLDQALTSISTISGVINDRREQVDALIVNADRLTVTLSDNRERLFAMVTHGGDLANSILRQRDTVQRLLVTLDALTAELSSMLGTHRDEISALVVKLDAMSQGLANNDQTLREIYELLPVTTRQLANVTGNGPYLDLTLPWSFFPDNWLCAAEVVEGCR